ncbi:AzlD domain-containing protein [Clostridium formicaceticum]|uniref:Branched-chain amino acid ABC transporter n=1 Tax=Clostridium formicaceticum TaxID=1497 RepID=A0AAC9RQ56_9CLOT|nr:AzlD domain-containing protein [Clostridium formicaceticum]AOY77693.1 branched-chain amino acid ABC transporter [Clostridium formicaceticum]ARE88280.1 Branched-chain amino acid transport protein (AzlD) [Clostridium formicaceticum]
MNFKLISIITGMALATFITRIGSQVIFTSTGTPDWMEKWLKHVPTAFLTALIIPAILLPKGYLDISFNNSYLLAGIIAAFTAYKTKNVLATIIIGMAIMMLSNNMIL